MQFTLTLEEDSTTPLYRRISNAIREAIIVGTVTPGQPLPSSRQLSESMKISRLTVTRSYEDLASQGWITVSARGKTFVSPNAAQLIGPSALQLFKQDHRAYHVEPKWSDFGERIRAHGGPADPLDAEFAFGAPKVSELPVTLWRQCLNKAVRSAGTELMLHEYNLGFMPLRRALHGLLGRTRGLRCTVSEVVVHARTAGGIDLLCRLMLQSGDRVAVEDPGSELIKRLFKAHGFDVQGVPVDRRGMKVDELMKMNPPPKLVYVCPSRHDPTGAMMDLDRRRELVSWAGDAGVFILEDDFDCEYRYGEKPLPSLQSLDQRGVVIYRYNFWKAMYPLVRLSVNVLPPNLVSTFSLANGMLYRDVPLVEQGALAEFIEAGHFERHVQKRHKQCAQRRAAALLELTRVFGAQLQIGEVTSGTDVRLIFAREFPSDVLAQAASASGLPLVATTQKYLRVPPVENEFTLNFSNISESRMATLIASFSRQLDSFMEA